jgi:hypothetical protein
MVPIYYLLAYSTALKTPKPTFGPRRKENKEKNRKEEKKK